MADQSELRYTPGRGLPYYLLDRVDDDSSSYNDGASRVFIGTHSCSIIEDNTSTLDTINTLTNSSLSNLFGFGSMSDSLRFSDQNLLQSQSNINMSSIGSEFYDSRISQSQITLSSDNRSLTNSTQERGHEVTMFSNISVMDTWCRIPVCFTKEQNQFEHDLFDDPFYSNNSTGAENMFPEYMRLLLDPEGKPQNEKDIEGSSNSLFYIGIHGSFKPISSF